MPTDRCDPTQIMRFGSLASHLAVVLLLPVLLVLGLFARPAALGMLLFIIVQSYVDYTFHGVTGQAFGALFDSDPSSVVVDQRSFWAFPLIYLAIFGAGMVSLDRLVANWRGKSRSTAAGHAGDGPGGWPIGAAAQRPIHSTAE